MLAWTPMNNPTPAAPASTPAAAASKRNKDNERPLVEDIRFLGRILGDVIREQEGEEAFDLIEQIRKLSVAFRRDADQEAMAPRAGRDRHGVALGHGTERGERRGGGRSESRVSEDPQG